MCISVSLFGIGCGQESTAPPANKAKKSHTLEAIRHDGFARKISGKVIFAGPLPISNQIKKHLDRNLHCYEGAKPFETIDQEWLGKEGGVANVVLFLKPPVGKYFPIHRDDRTISGAVELDQPHCVYIPHVVSLYPAYFDGRELIQTGQKLLVKNSGKIPHNTRFNGSKVLGNDVSFNVAVGSEKAVVLSPEGDPIPITCDIHSWMKAYAWVFNHPYHAVTNLDGTYEIPRPPAGTELTLVAWHEGLGYINQGEFKGEMGRKITLKENEELSLDFEISNSN